MKLSNVKRISKEDMSKLGEVPKWMDPLLTTLNDFIEKVTVAINGNLNFKDNFLCKEVEQDFTSGTEYEVNPRLDGRTQLRVYGVIPVDTLGAALDSFKWASLANGNISVTLTFTSAVSSKCRIEILLR